jgi:hypothetical protein
MGSSWRRPARLAIRGGWIAACAVLIAACGREAHEAPAVAPISQAAAPAQASASSSAIPHGDHNPKFGGLVLMNGELHFEVVMRRDGSYNVFFSDAVRAELPAATASGLTVTVTRTGQTPETVAMHIDDSGESWTGRGRTVDGPGATVRIAYSVSGKPYFIDVPFPA